MYLVMAQRYAYLSPDYIKAAVKRLARRIPVVLRVRGRSAGA